MRSLIGSEPKNINDHLTSDSKELLRNQILLFQEAGSAQPVELDFITSQGEIINTIHSISGTKDERGYASSLFCTIIDVSKLKVIQKKLNEVLVEANKNLEHKVDEAVAQIRQKDEALIKQSRLAAMGEMIATIAHEWRQPLNALGIQIQDLRIAYDYGEVNKEYIEEATTKSMRLIRSMSDMIDNFRKLFIIDEIQAEEFRIIDAIENAIEQLRLKSSIDGLEIVIHCDRKIIVTGHLSELSQAIFNILENAKEAIASSKPQKPLITLNVKEENNCYAIEIENHGDPIPDENIDRIFEPYYSTKKQVSGVGLGLFITKIIVEKSLNGKISISNTDNGVKFSINIPAGGSHSNANQSL
jgi:signal transduction histidine kinase